jgi:hypothetical protein
VTTASALLIDAGTVLRGPAGSYRVLGQQGRGAAGVTYRATRQEDERPAIVKVLGIAGMPGWKALELFEREAAVLGGLTHPRIPTFYDHFPLGPRAAPEGFALVMSLVEGQDLRRLARAGGLGPEAMLDMLDDVLDVLDYIHGRAPPLVHRDVNPKNIVFGPDRRSSLVDFGSVQAALRTAAGELTSAGTFGYAPLEQFMGRATAASDIYGLGMTFLAMASGLEPEQMPLAGIRVDVRQLLTGDPRLTRLISRMTEPDPRGRLASAADARRQLAAMRGQVMPAAASVPASALAAAPAGAAADYLGQLARRLEKDGFAVTTGGEVGRTPLAFSAIDEGSVLGDESLRIVAASARQLEGGGDKPLAPVPAALFVQAAGAALGAEVGLLGRLLARGSTVVPLIHCPRGAALRTAEHLAASLRESDGVTVVPVLVDGRNGQIDVVTPRSLLAGDPRDRLGRVRRVIGGR